MILSNIYELNNLFLMRRRAICMSEKDMQKRILAKDTLIFLWTQASVFKNIIYWILWLTKVCSSSIATTGHPPTRELIGGKFNQFI